MLSPLDYLVAWHALTLELKRLAIVIRCVMLATLATGILSCSKQSSNKNQADVEFGLMVNRAVAARFGTDSNSKVQYGYLNREINCATGHVMLDMKKRNPHADKWFIISNKMIVLLDERSSQYNDYISECGRRAHDLDRKLGPFPGVAD